MKIRILMSLRFVRRHPWHGVLSVIGISLGISVVVAMDVTNESARRAFQWSNAAISSGSTHYILAGPQGVDERHYAELRLDHGRRNIRPVVSGYVSFKGRRFLLLGVDPFSDMTTDRFHQPANGGLDFVDLLRVPDAVFMLDSSAQELGVNVPSMIKVGISGVEHELHLLGVMQPDNEIQQYGLRNVLVADISTAQSILGMQGRLTRIEVNTNEPEQIRGQLPRNLAMMANELHSRAAEQMTRAFHLNLTALSLLALIIGAFLIYNTMTLSILRRREQFAVLRTLGMTHRELFVDIVMEALVLAVIGFVLGSLVGVWISSAMLQLVSDTINNLYFAVHVQSVSVPPFSIVKAGLLALLVTTLAVWHPAWKAMRTSPVVNALRSNVEIQARHQLRSLTIGGVCLWCVATVVLLWSERSVIAGFGALFLIIIGFALITPSVLLLLLRTLTPVLTRPLGIIGRMAGRGVQACLSRTQVAVAALAITVSAVVGVSVMISSFRHSVEHWLNNFLRADVYVAQQHVHLASGIEHDVIEGISILPEVESVSTGRWSTVESESGFIQLFAIDVGPRGFRNFQFESGDGGGIWPRFLGEDVVIISESYAYHRDLSVGDMLTLPTDSGESGFEVAGIFYDYGSDRGVVTMHRNTYDRHWNDPVVSSFSLYLKEGIDVERFVDRLNHSEEIGQALRIRSNKTLRERSLQIFDHTFIITDVLRLLAVCIAVVGILSALMAIQLERAKEFAVLRALGLDRRQLGTLIVAESGLMGAAAGIIACPLGAVMAWVLIFIINRRSFGWTMQFYFHAEPWITALLLSVAAAVIAGLYPALRIAKAQPGAALKYE